MLQGANKKVQVNSKLQAEAPVKKQETKKSDVQFNTAPFLFETALYPKDNVTVANNRLSPALNFISFTETNNDTLAVQELKKIGEKYQIVFVPGENLDAYQHKVVKAVVIAKAKEHGIPKNVALGMAGLESEMKMWENVEGKNPIVVQGKNFVWRKDKNHPSAKAKKILTSTDWGVMQINDKAHPEAFPGVKDDLEKNIDYGLTLLSSIRHEVKGSLEYGFGDWDRTIGAYNLGHNPSGKDDHRIARRYILAVKGASRLN